MKLRLLSLTLLSLILAACGSSEDAASRERSTAVTALEAQTQLVARTDLSIGRLRADTAPAISAETAGRIQAIHADVGDEVQAGDLLALIDPEVQQIAVSSARADLADLQAQLENQQRQVERLKRLAAQQSIAEDQLDQAETRIETLEAQIGAANARLADAEYNLSRTEIRSPVSGRIQARMISSGDFVSPGKPVFELVSTQALRAYLPLPEHLQDLAQIGQTVLLSVPSRPDELVEAQVSDLRPTVGDGSRAIELIVALDNPGSWRPGGSVTGRIVFEQRQGLTVNPVSVVRRPAGEVVYVIENGRAVQRTVRTGLRGDGWVELRSGVEPGELVVIDGSGFLTDGALVSVKQSGEE